MTLRARFNMVRSQTPPIGAGGLAQKDWYLLWTNFWLAITEGMPQAPEAAVVGASPYVYTAVIRGQAHIGGGTVSAIEFSRDEGATWFNAGITSGFVQMDARDLLRVTYSVTPTITYFPM